MPEGKQLSFQYGEISPSLRYRSDAPFRDQALRKLRNGFVRKAGGVSNRQGLILLSEYSSQADLPEKYDDPTVTLHPFNSPQDNITKILGFQKVSGSDRAVYFLNRFGALLASNTTKVNSDGGEAKKAELIQVEDLIILTFGETDKANDLQILVFKETASDTFAEDKFQVNFNSGYSTLGATTIYGDASLNRHPCSYLVTKVTADGLETFFAVGSYANSHPLSLISTEFTIPSLDVSDNVRRYNIYRNSNSTINAPFGLVGSIPLTDGTTTSYTFTDFLPLADYLTAPPMNNKLWGTQPSSVNFYDTHELRVARRMMLWQQRLMVSYDETDDDMFDKGTIGVSKLGAPKMLHFPDVYRQDQAFEFSIPVEKSAPVIYMLSMERPIFFTKSNVFIAAGSNDRGIITPSEVNPLEISSEGCSETVAPKRSGREAYFINNDHTKLMRISFNIDGNVSVNEISILSDHLFEEDLITMSIVKTPEGDFVYILRRDGKLVGVNVNEGNAGFFLIDSPDCKIEDIVTTKNPYPFWNRGSRDGSVATLDRQETESLMCITVRDDNNPVTVGNKTRYIEVLAPRVDRFEEGFVFCDAAILFGTRLVLGEDGKYYAYGFEGSVATVNNNVNIEEVSGGGYSANTTVKLTATVDLSSTVGAATYIDFYYEDDDGYKRPLRFTRTGSPNWSGSIFDVEGFFSQDVPALLQDVTTQNPTNKDALQTRWCIPVRNLTGLRHLIDKEVSVYADGQVVSSPNNPTDTYTTLTVTESSGDGILDLGDHYGYGVVGLPYEFEMETLPIEPNDNRTYSSENKLINEASIAFEKTLGGYASDESSAEDNDKMSPIYFRENEDFDAPDETFSGVVDVNIPGTYDRESRVKIKQVDPLPMTILSVYPKGVSGG